MDKNTWCNPGMGIRILNILEEQKRISQKEPGEVLQVMGEKTRKVKDTEGTLSNAVSASPHTIPQLTVYSLEFCPNCEILKEYLNGRGIPYIEKDMSSREPLAELRMHGVFVREAPVLRKDSKFLTSEDLFKSGKLREEKIQELISGE